MAEAYIAAIVRTAGGRRNGRLSGWHAVELGAFVLDALCERAGVDPVQIEDVIMGCVQQVGEQGTNVARNCVLASRLPQSVPGTSVDRQCGSSQQALHFAAQAVMSETMNVVIAAGVETMSRIPLGAAAKVASGNGLGDCVSPVLREKFGVAEFSQFAAAEMIAVKHGFSRDDLDLYAFESMQRAIVATCAGCFREEIVPVPVRRPDGTLTGEQHDTDEGIRFDASLEAIRGVKLLREGGRISAASASQICDGAAAVLVVNKHGLRSLGLEPLARIVHISVTGGDPVIMLEAPLQGTDAALRRAGLRVGDIDLFEVNEAFAPVPLAWLKHTGADPARLNVRGGAIALGHPLGATGVRLMTTLVSMLRQRGARYGLQAMCEGGGMANITIVERC